MDVKYPTFTDIPIPIFCGEWYEGALVKKGSLWTKDGMLFSANLAHVASTTNAPYADPAVIYARQYRGTYSAVVTYAKYDTVTSAEGNQYISLVEDNIGHTPPTDGTDSAYWACYAKRGPQGLKGDAGVAASNQSIEAPSGTMDGSNQTFTLAHTPAGNIQLFYGGVMLREGVGYDFTVSGTTITLLGDIKPGLGENLMAVYLY